MLQLTLVINPSHRVKIYMKKKDDDDDESRLVTLKSELKGRFKQKKVDLLSKQLLLRHRREKNKFIYEMNSEVERRSH